MNTEITVPGLGSSFRIHPSSFDNCLWARKGNMAKKPVRKDLPNGEWVEFVGKLPMAVIEKWTTLAQGIEGEGNLESTKRLSEHIPSIVHAWSLESDLKSVNLWEDEDAGDLVAIVQAMSEYVTEKMNLGKSANAPSAP